MVGPVALPRAEPVGDERHGDRGEDAAGRDLEQHVGHGVDALVDAADPAGAHGVGEDEDAREARGPGEQRRDGDEPGGPRDAGGEAATRHRAGRPQASSSRSPGVDSMTRVKRHLLGGQGEGRRARRGRRAGPGDRCARAARCRRSAPAALAPVSPSIAVPARSGPQHAEGGTGRGGGPARRPGRTAEQERERGEHRRLEGAARAQVEQVGQVGGAGDDGPADEGVEARRTSSRPRSASAAATSPVAPMPTTLTSPVVTSPRRGGAEVAPQALAGAVTGEVVEGAEGPRAQRRDDARPARPRRRRAPAPAT